MKNFLFVVGAVVAVGDVVVVDAVIEIAVEIDHMDYNDWHYSMSYNHAGDNSCFP